MCMIIVVVVCSCIMGGCVRLTGIEYVPALYQPSEYVEIVDVVGTTIELADGSRYRLLGIKNISDSVKEFLMQNPVMLDIYDDTAMVMYSRGHTFFPGPNRSFTLDGSRDLILFPTKKWVLPVRFDLAKSWLASGEAQADLAEITDDGLRANYKAAETEAKQSKQGMWSKEK